MDAIPSKRERVIVYTIALMICALIILGLTLLQRRAVESRVHYQ